MGSSWRSVQCRRYRRSPSFRRYFTTSASASGLTPCSHRAIRIPRVSLSKPWRHTLSDCGGHCGHGRSPIVASSTGQRTVRRMVAISSTPAFGGDRAHAFRAGRRRRSGGSQSQHRLRQQRHRATAQPSTHGQAQLTLRRTLAGLRTTSPGRGALRSQAVDAGAGSARAAARGQGNGGGTKVPDFAEPRFPPKPASDVGRGAVRASSFCVRGQRLRTRHCSSRRAVIGNKTPLAGVLRGRSGVRALGRAT
jgi:hypothetical protein